MEIHTGSAAAELLALMPVVFVPFNIPTLSYKTMGMGLLSLGLLFQLRAVGSSDSAKLFRAAGLAHGFACLAYPSLAAVPVFMLGLISCFAPTPRRTNAIAYALPVALIGALCGLVVVLIGVDALAASIYYTTSGPPRFVDPFQGALSQLKGEALVVGWLVGIGLSFRFARWLLVPMTTALPVVLFLSLSRWEAPTDSLFFVIYLAAMAPCFAFVAGDRGWARAVGIWVMLPAVLAAMIFSFTSATCFWNSSLGWFPVSIFTRVFIVMAVRNTLTPTWATWAMLLPLVAVNGVLVFARYAGVYREPTIDRLIKCVGSGPYAGL